MTQITMSVVFSRPKRSIDDAGRHYLCLVLPKTEPYSKLFELRKHIARSEQIIVKVSTQLDATPRDSLTDEALLG